MRISDWSSDVCSSDLLDQIMDEVEGETVVIVDDEDHRVLLPVTRCARKPHCFARRGEQRAGLGFAFALFIQRIAVGDDAGAGLDVHRSEEHTSELQSLMRNSYAVFCLKKKKTTIQNEHKHQ